MNCFNIYQPYYMGANKSRSSFLEEKIIFEEPLYPIGPNDTFSISHRSIGAMTFLNIRKRSCAGSGVMLSKNLLFTVAHNIYDKQNSLYQKDRSEEKQLAYELDKQSFRFYIGGVVGETYYEVEDWRYLPEYRTCREDNKLRSDYALVKLKTNVQYKQFMELSFPCFTCLNQKVELLQIFGYPIYKDNYESITKNGKKLKLTQYGLARQNRLVYFSPEQCKIGYAISTLGGQSGSPVVLNQRIIAIHNGGGNKGQQFNIGRIATPDLINNLIRWGKQLRGQPFRVDKTICPHQIAYYYEFIPEEILSIIEKTKTDEELRIDNKGLEIIDVTKHINVKNLTLFNNRIAIIDLRYNINLQKLQLGYNRFMEIDLTANTKLTQLYIHNNYLATIDLSTNTHLTHLHLHNNQLKAIDLSTNTKLVSLSLSCNQLAAIDLSNNSLLAQLQLHENNLTAVSVNYSLKLKDYLFSNQRSAYCKLILLHGKDESQQCRETGESEVQIYNNDCQQNKHNCKYRIIMVERT